MMPKSPLAKLGVLAVLLIVAFIITQVIIAVIAPLLLFAFRIFFIGILVYVGIRLLRALSRRSSA